MTTETPTLSIGVPVHNEGSRLRPTLESLLAQDFSDFELIISDNASTDDTEAVCAEYVARDPRVRYYRNEANQGAIANFNRVFELSRGKYFMWAGGHDLWSTGMTSACVKVLEHDPMVVLCCPAKTKIDLDGNVVQEVPCRLDTRQLSGDPAARFLLFLWGGPHALTIMGVMRSSTLHQVGTFRATYGPDLVLLARLSLAGAAATIPQERYFSRVVRSDLSFRQQQERYRQSFFSANERPRRWCPVWRFGSQLCRAVLTARLSLSSKAFLLLNVFVYMLRMRPFLLSELLRLGRP